jgi:transposase
MYSLDIRVLALRVLEHAGSFRKAARILDMSASSLWRWSKKVNPKGWPNPGTRVQALTAAIGAFVTLSLQKSPWLTRACLKALIAERFVLDISLACVGAVVRACGFSLKRLRHRLVRRNNPRALEEWDRSFRDGFLRHLGDREAPIVAIDECGFDGRMLPLYGYSERGVPAVARVTTISDRKRHNLIMAIRNVPGGSEVPSHHYELVTESVTGCMFADFVRSLPFPPGTTVIYDNATIHRTDEVFAALREKGFLVARPPPYMPTMNPIELLFSRIKRQFRRERAGMTARVELGFGARRMRALIEEAIGEQTTPEAVRSCFRHVHNVISGGLPN